jgi:excinuclease ABC subunit A
MFKGRTIADVLDMSCKEALVFFANQPTIARHLQTLVDVGLGYIRLGQPAPTLSGGEAQRVKLSSELSRRPTGHTLYVLDEPTTGLHFDDVRKLLEVLSRLVDHGNTVIVIEHNLDVIKTADWIIDLGPEGGERGGLVVAEGTPEEVAAVPGSYTGQVLIPVLTPGGRAARGKTPTSPRPGRPGTGRVNGAVRTTKISAPKASAAKGTAAKTSAGKTSAGKASAGKTSAGKATSDRGTGRRVAGTRNSAARVADAKVSAKKVSAKKASAAVKTARPKASARKASVR